ncbi:unnamed protein product [Paramecium primaurelia]|uniref:AIG1-type G domain-containing protein n=1 Tax=Paramecium primaurelia TaxID=5886 RepID=A0A8S1KA02_PARPR|nr:unnamed protein product [Paramecium primaurelia]
MILPVIGIAVIPRDTLSFILKAMIIFIYIGGIILLYLHQKQTLELQKILLIGQSGVGKTQTYNYLKCKTIMNFDKFQLGKIGDLCIVDTPTMDLESSIANRENTISQFQKFFINFKNSISAIIIVVNFERTDIMKRKLIEIIKYFKKFQNMIYILITDFHLSEDHDNDKSKLLQSLQYLHPQGIIFLNKEENEQMIIEELNAIERKSTHQEFDINDTIFAIINEKMNASFMDQINLIIKSPNPLHEVLIKKNLQK